ncbi:hypothetical protein X743_25990 [Mesorhizobium sp. LNHC252B00]|nr:hypothetical protein X743_25990 [Mesorhizobium sp. LNHC252B00]
MSYAQIMPLILRYVPKQDQSWKYSAENFGVENADGNRSRSSSSEM